MKINTAFFNQLSRRERFMLLVGGIVLLGFGLWGLSNLSRGYSDKMDTLERLIQQKQEDRVTLVRLRHEYGKVKGKIQSLEERVSRDQGRFSLLSYLESLAQKQAMRSNITYMRPQPPSEVGGYREVGVEIKMENVTLEQVVRMFSSMETAPHLIRVKRVRLRTRFSDSRFMDTTFLATTYEKK